MGQIVTGHYTPDGGDVYLPIGFVPDWFQWAEHGASAPLIHYWWEMMQDDEASGSQEGIIDDGDGTRSKAADDAGFQAYDSESASPTISDYTVTVSTNATARTATAHGTYVRPSTSSDTDREAIFECVTAGTGSAEPTWPAGIGDQVTDGSVVFERVNVATSRVGYKGILVADNLQTDGQEAYFLALQADRSIDLGDVDGWSGGIYGA